MLASKPQLLGSDERVILARALERFNASSEALEQRHQELMAEVERLRAELKQKDEAVKQAERLAMLGETAAALAHEVRNPLGAITLFLSMLRSDVQDRPQALELVEQIEKSVTSLDGVVSNVLHFARTTQLHLHPLHLHSLLHEVHDHFLSLYAPGASLTLTVSGSPFVVADQQALRQCLYNLVTNALQVTNYRGRIELEASGEQPDGGDVRIVVRDNGPGIPVELGAAVFEPFISTRQGGTGLGLSIVKRLLEAHGGSITVRNTPGAEFTITLPRNGVRHQQKGVKDAGV